MASLGNITRSRNFYVETWYRAISPGHFYEVQNKVLDDAARRIQKKARELARMPMSPQAYPGYKSGNLWRSIKIAPPTTSPTQATTQVVVYVDLEMTPTDKGVPYAIYQERGTGIYGKYKRPFKAKKGRFMTWKQEGIAYRGPNVKAHLIRKKVESWTWKTRKNPWAKSSLPRKIGTGISEMREYQQYAYEVKGARPKHYWRDATSDAEIKNKMKEELGKATKKVLKTLASRK